MLYIFYSSHDYVVGFGYWSDRFLVCVKSGTTYQTIQDIKTWIHNRRTDFYNIENKDDISVLDTGKITIERFIMQGDGMYREAVDDNNTIRVDVKHQGTLGGFALDNGCQDNLYALTCEHVINKGTNAFVVNDAETICLGRSIESNSTGQTWCDISLIQVNEEVKPRCITALCNESDQRKKAFAYEGDLNKIGKVYKKGYKTGWTQGHIVSPKFYVDFLCGREQVDDIIIFRGDERSCTKPDIVNSLDGLLEAFPDLDRLVEAFNDPNEPMQGRQDNEGMAMATNNSFDNDGSVNPVQPAFAEGGDSGSLVVAHSNDSSQSSLQVVGMISHGKFALPENNKFQNDPKFQNLSMGFRINEGFKVIQRKKPNLRLSFDDSVNSSTSEEDHSQSSEEDHPHSSEEDNPQSSEEDNPKSSEEDHPQSSEEDHPHSSEEDNPQSSEEDHPKSSEEDHPQSSEEDHPQSSEDHPQSSEEDHPQSSEEDHPQSSEEDHPQSLRSADKVGRPFCCCIVFSLFLLLLFYFFPTICVLRFLCHFSSDLSDIWPVDR